MTPIDALYHFAADRPAQAVMIAGDRYWTYARFAADCEHLAKGLLARGVRPGDRVALHMANLPEMAMAYYACFRIGAIAAPLNIRLKTAELRPILKKMQASVYLGQAKLYPEIADIGADILPAHTRYVVGGPVDDKRVHAWDRVYDGAAEMPLPPMPDPDAPAVLLATSGTSGTSKLAIHTAKTLGAGIEAFADLGFRGQHTALNTVPLVHGSGLVIMLLCMRFGARMILLERFDAVAALDAIVAHRCTWMLGLPFMFADMVRAQSLRPRNVASLRFCVSAGDVCPVQLQSKFANIFALPLYSTWAATEVFGVFIHGLQPGPVCRVQPPTQIRLVDDKGAPVRRGEIGELLVKAPQTTTGYWAGPGHIEEATRDGWYHTGDLMRQGDNYDFWFVARKKNLIIRGGSNISPLEVEHVLLSHPAVRDAAVVGIPDERLGQRVAAVVQLAADADGDALADVLRHTREQLAEYKVPERLEVVAKVPRSGIGKIDRNRLAAHLDDAENEAMAEPV